MLSQSFTFRIFKSISHKLTSGAVYYFFMRLGAAISSVYGRSILKKYIDTAPFLNKSWSKSIISGAADAVFSVFRFLVVKTGDFLIKISEGSVCRWILEATFGRLGYSNTLAVMIGAMFLCNSTRWNNMYALIASVLMFVVLVYKCRRGPLKPSQLDFFMVLFGVSLALGVIVAPNKADAVRVALIAATALLLLLVTAVSLDSEEKLQSFLKIVSGAVALTAVFAIVQRFMGVEVNKEFVDINTNAGMPGRVFSTMENPNNYAELLVFFVPFMFALFVSAKNVAGRLLWGGAAILSLVALAMTYSRSCYVALAIAAVIFILIYDFRLVLPLICIAIVAIPFLPETVMNRILTIGSLEDSSNSYRLYIWDTCANLILNYGVSGLGVGPDAFAALYKPIAHSSAIKAPHSHMLYMEVILEYGVLGFIGFFGYYIRIIRNALSRLGSATKNQRAYVAAGVGALGGICFVSLAEYIWFYPRDMFAHFIVMGALVAITGNISKGNGGRK